MGNNTLLVVLLLGVGLILIHAAVKGKNPIELVKEALTRG